MFNSRPRYKFQSSNLHSLPSPPPSSLCYAPGHDRLIIATMRGNNINRLTSPGLINTEMRSTSTLSSRSSRKLVSRCRTRTTLRCNWCFSLLFLLLLLPFTASIRPEPSGKGSSALQNSAESATIISHRILQDKVKLTPRERPPSQDRNKSRRDLSRLGSSPPQCNSKCGYCTPCKAVHVPIQPGLVRTTEYYPEAWRCKCGNKLYMP